MQDTEMVPYVQKTFESPVSTRSNSPDGTAVGSPMHHNQCDEMMSDDEISVGCPSPALTSPKHYNRYDDPNTEINQRYGESDDYFKPLKRLKMVNPDKSPQYEPEPEPEQPERSSSSENGVKSFSIIDILNHRPARSLHTPRIVRPWDIEAESEAQQSLERFHRQLKAQQLALLRPEFASAFNSTISYTSETGSDRSSSVTSDCCSPDIVPTTSRSRHPGQQKGPPGSTPLDALFQMTSKTFDSTNGESSTGIVKILT